MIIKERVRLLNGELHGDRVLIAAGTAEGRSVNSAEFFVPSRNAFEPAMESANGESGDPSISIGTLNPDATVRAVKSYRVTLPKP